MISAPPPLPWNRKKNQLMRRNYLGAQIDRLTNDWYGSGTTANQAVHGGLATLRSRAQDLERNNDFVRRFLSLMKVNVAGPAGVTLQAAAKDADGTPDRAANKMIEAAYARWSRPGTCTMDGRFSRADLEAVAVQRLLVDGEVILRKHRGAANDFGYALELMPPECLDETFNEENRKGNRIIMGVEVDAYTRPVAYWFNKGNPASVHGNTYSKERFRVPAEDILHWFISERPQQIRGVPWIASSMRRTKLLDGMEEAVVVGTRVSAAKMGFFKGNEEYRGDGVDPDGWTRTTAEPGEFEQIPNGLDLVTFDPQYPPADYGDFEKALKRGLSSGMGPNYTSMANDLEGVNYSSIRQGALDDHDFYRWWQRQLIEHVLEPNYETWLLMAITTQALRLPLNKLWKWQAVKYQPRGWAWVDPKKEAEAYKVELSERLTSPQRVVSGRGEDYEQIIEEIAEAKRIREVHGVTDAEAEQHLASTGASPEGDDDDEGDDDE